MKDTRRKALPAIEVAEKILGLAVSISNEEINEALRKLNMAEGTWGILWGNPIDPKSGLDLDYYQLKKKVLEFIRDLHQDKAFPIAILMEKVRRR